MIDFSYSYDSEDTEPESIPTLKRYPKEQIVYRGTASRDFSGEEFDDSDYDYWNRYYD